MRGNTDQNNSEYGHFLRSETRSDLGVIICTERSSGMLFKYNGIIFTNCQS